MAGWLLWQVWRGIFIDPSEAVFAIVQNFIEMEPHRDLRDELLRRILDESVARGLEDVKAGRVRPADEVFDELRRELAKPRPEPARWQKIARWTSSPPYRSEERRVGQASVSTCRSGGAPYN